jgi:uncharacterized protein (DUF1501 family)
MSSTDGRRFGRRQFLVGAGAATVGAGLGATAAVTRPWASGSAHAAAPAGPLVLVTLYGGNDGLNTVVPIDDPAYLAARPTLGYQPNQVLPLSEGLGLNPELKGLKALWDARQLAIVLGVGYPDPSLSHFQSMDVWQTANAPGGEGTGWVGRWLDSTGSDPMRAISVGPTLPPAMRGARSAASALTSDTIAIGGDPAYHAALSSLIGPGPDRTGLAASVASAGADLLAIRQDLARLDLGGAPRLAAAPNPAGPRLLAAPTGHGLSAQLGLVARLITAGAPTRVYQVSTSSYDTHADEKTRHERLLADLGAAVLGFFTALQGSAHGGGTVLATYSEFGRRPAENASGGTDHGTAAPLFVAGPAVKGGRFYGEQPSLRSLDSNGNLVFNVDFRSVYATLLDQVVGVDPTATLGRRYPLIGLL